MGKLKFALSGNLNYLLDFFFQLPKVPNNRNLMRINSLLIESFLRTKIEINLIALPWGSINT